MTRAADILDVLLSRKQGRLILERKTGLPYGWGVWLRRLPVRAAAFGVEDVTSLMVQRPALASAGVLPQLTPWQAMRRLGWQGWDPPPRDQRGLRWLAGFCSGLLHLLFAVFLMWVALVRTPPAPAAAEAGERVQVEYIGRGTPDQEGGGTPASYGEEGAETARPTAAARPPSSTRRASASAVESPPDAPDSAAAAEPVPAPEPAPAPAVAQPLQVTEVAEPVADFVLPRANTLPPRVEVPTLRTPELQVRVRPVEIAEEAPPAIEFRNPVPLVRPEVAAPQVQVREREIAIAPSQMPVTSQVRQREVQARIRTPELAVREAQIPAAVENETTPASTSTRANASAESASATHPVTASTTAAQAARPPAGNPASGTSAGAGPRPQDRSGGWEAPARADDWASAKRDVPGTAGQPATAGKGVFNADGSVRVPGTGDGQGESRRGAPGGDSDTWSRERIADSGTWLKRPPYDYTPTSFDKYWVPSESLLAEWVRKGIKNIEIPIPGTNTRISCVVSLLQFGGGCGLSNPNMQEQPAVARPPPDIPFKKELQEDNGSR